MSFGLEDHAVSDYVRGGIITGIELRGDQLRIDLKGETLVIEDMGQNCCEKRYMTCDDDLEWYAGRGARLLDIEVRDAPSIDGGDDEHEVQFLLVTTDKGVITCETHNEHNGFYGGFSVRCSVVQS